MLQSITPEYRPFIVALCVLGAILLIIGIAFISTQGGRMDRGLLSDESVVGVSGGPAADMAEEAFYARNNKGFPPTYPSPEPGNSRTTGADRSVIQTASLSLLVTKAEDTVDAVTDVVLSAGGFVEHIDIFEVSEDVKNGSMMVRVPEDKLRSTTESIKKLAIRIEHESLNSQDVTDQIIDLEARLKNLRASETQLRALLTRAGKITEILEVERELTRTRDEIERSQAQLESVKSRVSYSIISLVLTSEPDTKVFGIHWRPLYVAKLALRTTLEDAKNFVDGLILFIVRLPLLLLKLGMYLLGLFVIYVVGKKFYHWGREKFL